MRVYWARSTKSMSHADYSWRKDSGEEEIKRNERKVNRYNCNSPKWMNGMLRMLWKKILYNRKECMLFRSLWVNNLSGFPLYWPLLIGGIRCHWKTVENLAPSLSYCIHICIFFVVIALFPLSLSFLCFHSLNF